MILQVDFTKRSVVERIPTRFAPSAISVRDEIECAWPAGRGDPDRLHQATVRAEQSIARGVSRKDAVARAVAWAKCARGPREPFPTPPAAA